MSCPPNAPGANTTLRLSLLILKREAEEEVLTVVAAAETRFEASLGWRRSFDISAGGEKVDGEERHGEVECGEGRTAAEEPR